MNPLPFRLILGLYCMQASWHVPSVQRVYASWPTVLWYKTRYGYNIYFLKKLSFLLMCMCIFIYIFLSVGVTQSYHLFNTFFSECSAPRCYVNKQLLDVRVLKGEPAELSCTVSKHEVTGTWFKDGLKVGVL